VPSRRMSGSFTTNRRPKWETYAYVNPVVAVLGGYFLGGEAIGLRTIVGTLLVLVSVVVIATTPKKKNGTRNLW